MTGLFNSFDAPFSFEEEEYFFTYKGYRFKLQNGGERFTHTLISIVSERSEDDVVAIALEFLGCLAFEAKMPVIYQGTFGSGSFNEALMSSSARPVSTPRGVKLSVVNHRLPRSILNIRKKQQKQVISMFHEALIASRSLPQYCFLGLWKIVSIIEKEDSPKTAKKICEMIGVHMIERLEVSNEEEATQLLYDLHNRTKHALGKNKRQVFIMDLKTWDELNTINHKLIVSVSRLINDYFDDQPPLNLYEKDGELVYLTEAEYYGYEQT